MIFKLGVIFEKDLDLKVEVETIGAQRPLETT